MENTSNSNKWGGLAIVAALVAVGLLGYLTVEYYHLKLGLSSGKSVCNISSSFNCEVVAVSAYASLFGIPMALWGLWTNLVFVGVMSASVVGLSDRTKSSRLGLALGSFILLTSVVMALISATQLGTYCLFCIGTYVASIVVFLGAWLWHRAQERGVREVMPSLLRNAKGTLTALVAIPALAFFSHKVMMDNYGAGQLDVVVQESLNDWSSTQVQTFDTNGLVFQAGQGDPKVTLVEFIDLLCPHCKTATPSLHAFVEGRPDVRLVLKIFPLDGTCNPDTHMHAGDGLRCQLSYTVMCAQKLRQKGWEALNWVFDKQAALYGNPFNPVLEDISKELDLPLEEMKTCLAQPETLQSVTAMAAEGIKADVRGTPSIYLNGKHVDRGQFLPVLDAVYQKVR